jgi:ADP-dependent phosphofructokinase/glucokinase
MILFCSVSILTQEFNLFYSNLFPKIREHFQFLAHLDHTIKLGKNHKIKAQSRQLELLLNQEN